MRYAPVRRLSTHAKLLLLVAAMAVSFIAYIILGDVSSAGHHATAQVVSQLQYRPDIVATASLNETFTLDGLRYAVHGAVNRGRAYGFQKAEGMFIEVAIAAENAGTAQATPHAIGMIDKEGTQYAQLPQFSLDGTTYSEVMERGLEPGGAGTFFALFDVASSSTGLWLSLHARDGVAARVVSLGM